MSINPSTLAAFDQFYEKNKHYYGVTETHFEKLKELVTEGLLTESDFKLHTYVIFSLVDPVPASGMGFSNNTEARIQALRDKVITPLQLQEFFDLDLRPHSMAGVDLALSDPGLMLLRNGEDLKTLINVESSIMAARAVANAFVSLLKPEQKSS